MSDNDFELASTGQEWSHFIESDDIGVKKKHIEISPPENVIPTLCQRLNIHSIKVLKAVLTLQRNNVNKVIYIEGRIFADICQKCIITDEPVAEIVEDTFEAWFSDTNQTVSFAKARRERLSRKEQDDQPMLEEVDDPEAIVDGKIDLGEVVVQNLSLSLNPYPRSEGAVYGAGEAELEDAPEGTYNNPFAALKDWKAKEKKTEK